MKNILIPIAAALMPFTVFSDTSSEKLSDPKFEQKLETLWDKTAKTFYSPKTNIFYTRSIDKIPGPELINEYKPLKKNGDPNYMGGGTGTEDCSMLCGIMLAGLCDKYEIKKDAATADWARKLAKGLMLADTVHGDPGFVARGVSPADGKSVYPETSRDQYTHNIHGLWRYFNSPIATDAEKKEISEIFCAVAEKMKREIRPDTNPPYTYKLHKGVPDKRGVAKMHDVYPHEAARLAMLYAAAYDATKNKKYLNWYRAVYDDAVGGSAKFIGMRETYYKHLVPPYSIAQMNASLELIREVEPDPSRKLQISIIMDAISEFIDKYKVYHVSDKSVRDAAEIMWGQMLANGYRLSPARENILKQNIVKIHERDPYGAYMVFSAYWRARLDEERGK